MSIVINSWCVNTCALYICSFLLKKNLKRKICIRQMIKKTGVNSINIRKHIDQKGKKNQRTKKNVSP